MKINKRFFATLILFSSFSMSAFAIDTNAALKQGIANYKESNYIGCLQRMAEVLSSDPSNALAHYYTGMSNIRLGNTSKGEESYIKVIKLNTNEHLTRLAKDGLAGIVVANYDEKSKTEDEENLITNARSKGEVRVARLTKEKSARDSELKRLEELQKQVAEAEFEQAALTSGRSETQKKIEVLESRLKTIEKEKKNAELAAIAERGITQKQIEYLYKKNANNFATPENQRIIEQIDLNNLKNDFNQNADNYINYEGNNSDKKKVN